MLRIVRAEEYSPARSRAIDPATLSAAEEIVADVRRGGWGALQAHATRLGDLAPGAPLVYARDELRGALGAIEPAQREILTRAATSIRAFAEAQRACLRELDIAIAGGRAGHRVEPVTSAGCYAPGGRFPLPSSVLMTAVTARAAGVEQVWVASPRPAPATLAAAAIAGADGLLACGGAQAVAAMAYGAGVVPASDIIVGPGNRWVTAAKQIVSADVGIDMLAGPSELLVIADETASAAVIAADLLAQAEHDDDAVPILVSTSETLARAVNDELARQLETLPTRATASKALRNGAAVLAASIDEAVAVADRIGPEHLQIMTRDAREVAARVRHAGAVFIGGASAEVYGDYGAGPNHVLPTGGTARVRAGLSVFTFLRARTWLEVDEPSKLAGDAAALARIEGLEGHARAAEIRLS